MSTEENKAVIQRWIAARNAHNLEAALALWTDDWHDRLAAAFNSVTESFPDVHITPNELLAEGDMVAVGWTFTGTHLGPYRDIPATGITVNWSGIDIYTVTDGRIASLVREADSLTVLQQLGANIIWQDRVIV
jgi:steroid delta-isomerase-like uncharacterized protein